MAKDMGEFEERPQVKEATPVPLKRERPIGWIVATVVFALIAIGAIGYIVVDKITPKKTEPTREESEQGAPEEADLRKKEGYDDIINESLAVFKDKLSRGDAIVVDDDEAGGAYVKIDDGIYTSLDYGRSVGVLSAYSGLTDEVDSDLRSRIENVFTKHGFKKDDSISSEVYYIPYTDGKGSVCQYRESWPLVVCGHETWISDENKDLTKQLGAAYKKKINPSDGSRDLLPAKTSDVVRSSVPGYERISVSAYDLKSGFGAVMLFYKKDGEEWRFFRTTQATLACDFYTGDVAKAFAGDPCIDGATGATKKIGE